MRHFRQLTRQTYRVDYTNNEYLLLKDRAYEHHDIVLKAFEHFSHTFQHRSDETNKAKYNPALFPQAPAYP